MKTIKSHWIYLSFCLFLFTLFYQRFFYICFICTLLLWFLRTKDSSFIFVSCLLLWIGIPKYSTDIPTMTEGKAIVVKGNYSIIQSSNQKLMVYSDEPLQLDATYTISRNPEYIESSSHFYGFNYSEWCHKQGVYYSINEEDIARKKENFSIRHTIQTKIESISNTNTQQILYKSLLNITLKDTDDSNWFYSNGFSYAGVLAIFNVLLKRFLDKTKRQKVLITLNLLMMVIYRFPLLLVESFLFRLLSFKKGNYKSKTGFVVSLIILLYPQEITSITFLLPVIYRYSFLFKDKYGPLWIGLLIQSLTFNYVNPIKSLLYRFLMKLYGFLYLLALIEILVPIGFIHTCSSIMNVIVHMIDTFNFNGSIFGIGCIFYLAFILCMYNHKHFYFKSIILLFIFLFTGLFHPFMELTIINVGQGDSIYLRGPLNSTNVLIDTGKESAYSSLNAFLKGKGVDVLNALIITHPDEDHNGNQENLNNDYIVKETITEHESSYKIGVFQLNDLNTISNDDTNESSIVNVFNLNGKQVCLMGDSDQTTEETIVNQNPSLSCDILKVSHHGSKTGSSDKFLDIVKPQLALISSGNYNIYHHPSEEVIQKLLKRHIPYLDTKTSGDITIVCIFGFNVLITSNWSVALL